MTRRPDALAHDEWAHELCGPEGFELAERFDQVFPHMELWMELRTAYLDRLLHRTLLMGDFGAPATEDLPGQVVILGAGFDARAARLSRLPARFFEVDQPETQREKRERVAKSEYPKDSVTYVPCDFESQDFLDRLVASGFDVSAPAVILWEGVTPYLSERAVRATLSRVANACDARSVIAFDYVEKRMVAEGAKLNDTGRKTREVVKDLGEPVTFGVDHPLAMLHETGFRHVETVSFDDIALSLTGTYERQRQFRFQHIAVASRSAPSWLKAQAKNA